MIVRHDVALGIAAYAGPVTVIAMILGVLVMQGKAKFLLAFSPMAAFLTSWYVTVPYVQVLLPPDQLVLKDNMHTIWLAMWTVGATALLSGYVSPLSHKSLPVNGTTY